MTDPQTPAPGRPWKRRRFYVHKFQRKYAIVLGISLFAYSGTLFGLALLALYVPSALNLDPEVPVEERFIAAKQFLALTESIWPAIIGLILAAAFFSIFRTHRIAGPLYRLHMSAKELAEGNLTLRIRFRKGDDLHELADAFNKAVMTFESGMAEVRDREALARKAVHESLEKLRAQPGGDLDGAGKQDVVGQLESALKEGEQIDAVFSSFRFSQ